MVFVTKVWRGALTGEPLDILREAFAKVCTDLGTHLVKMNGEDDHVHMLVECPPKVAVSALVNPLKGVPSRLPRKHHRARTHRDHPWSPSHSAAPFGGTPLQNTRQYVDQQGRPN